MRCIDTINVKLALLRALGVIYLKNLISKFRKEHGYTQKDLADLLCVSRQTIISLERGRYNPSILLAYRIAKIFGRSIEDVFLFEEETL